MPPTPPVKVEISQEARRPCEGAALALAIRNAEAFGTAQTGSLAVCETRRSTAVTNADDFNAAQEELYRRRLKEHCENTRGLRFWKDC
jgi:hypothetical protein